LQVKQFFYVILKTQPVIHEQLEKSWELWTWLWTMRWA